MLYFRFNGKEAVQTRGKQFEKDFFNDPAKAEWAKQPLGSTTWYAYSDKLGLSVKNVRYACGASIRVFAVNLPEFLLILLISWRIQGMKGHRLGASGFVKVRDLLENHS